jgi:uncharacterized protein
MPHSDLDIEHRLRQARTIAVVGISDDPSKPSHYVSAYMQTRGYTIIPVNPKYALRGEKILGQTCYAHLTDIPESKLPVDIVNCFRPTMDIVPIAQDAVTIQAKGLWQQVGVDSEAATAIAEQAGLWCVSDACLMVEHRRLIG